MSAPSHRQVVTLFNLFWSIVIFIGITILPFLGQIGSFEPIKVSGVYGMSILSIIGIVIAQKKYYFLRISDVLYLVWLLILFFSSLQHPVPLHAFAGWFGRGQGVLFFLGIWVISMYLRVSLRYSEQYFTRLFVGGYFVEIVLIILQYMFPSLFHNWIPLQVARATGTFGEPNTAAAFCVVALPLVHSMVQKIFSKSHKIRALIWMLSFIAIVSTGSRIALACWFFLFIWNIFRNRSAFNKYRIAIIALCATILGIIGVISLSRGYSFAENRIVIWKYAINAIIQKPFLGYGAESQEMIFEKAFFSDNISIFPLVIDRAHNVFLDIALWSGLLGLAVWIAFLYSLFCTGRWTVFHMGIVVFCVFAFFQPVQSVIWILFTMYWSILATQDSKDS